MAGTRGNMLQILLYLLLAIVLAVTAFAVVNRPQLVVVEAEPPADFPADGFSHAAFEELLRQHVGADGRVDYAAWHASDSSRSALRQYLAAVARYSPDTTPQRFDGNADELAYWMYAYNAYVIHSVLQHWPLASVTDVRAPVELVRGLGFFWRQRFLFGTVPLSLYAVENDRIRERYRDARIHFVLNCGSESCPLLRPELPRGEQLEPFLQQAARDFVNDPRNVGIDHGTATVRLSPIFRWYRKDFLDDLRFRGLPADGGLLAYIDSVAPEALQRELGQARDYRITYGEYDWSLNER